MSGRISSLPLKLGQGFQKGDLLVGFECDHQEAEQASADAQLLKAEKTLESKVGLAAMKAVSDLDVQLAQADVAQAKAQRERARASVRDCRILAPYNGSVVRVLANQWESVPAGSPLLEIIERGNLHVEALVQSSWLTWLKPGSRFKVTVDELGSEVTAEVTGIGARVDPVSQTVAVSARILGNLPGLRAGMSGNASFTR
jgi:RND family efflux transporter MFP subunit